jgi:hypothetical protein
MSEQTSYYPELAKKIQPADGRLGVLLPGLGAVATTFIAGVLLARKGLAHPFLSRNFKEFVWENARMRASP